MAAHNAIMNWPHTGRYEPGFFVGSESESGEHLRDMAGWPYSIYRKALAIGATDVVLCHGIQHPTDAVELCAVLNGRERVERFQYLPSTVAE